MHDLESATSTGIGTPRRKLFVEYKRSCNTISRLVAPRLQSLKHIVESVDMIDSEGNRISLPPDTQRLAEAPMMETLGPAIPVFRRLNETTVSSSQRAWSPAVVHLAAASTGH